MAAVGKKTIGASTVERPSDDKWAARYELPVGWLVKLSAFCDGSGSGGTGMEATQLHRAICYDATGTLMAQGVEVAITEGQSPGWVDFPFTEAVEIERAGFYDLGTIAGGQSLVTRFYFDDPSVHGSRHKTDTYDDGPDEDFSGATVLTADLSLFATLFTRWQPPTNETEFYYARLPFAEAQAKLGETMLIVTEESVDEVECGWHGTVLDRERGAFAIVRRDGPLESLLGERIRLTTVEFPYRVVIAYVHRVMDIDDDISLTRRLFTELAAPSNDYVTVTIDVLPA